MEESQLTVDFDGRELIYGFTELDELILAYATTIHTSSLRGTAPESSPKP
jgi:exodeoxyribonuclease V alpha subunit